MTNTCPQCGALLEPTDSGVLPPWCRSCGADLKIDRDALRENSWSCTSSAPTVVDTSSPTTLDGTHPALPSEANSVEPRFADTTELLGETAEAIPSPDSIEDELTQFARKQLGLTSGLSTDSSYRTTRKRELSFAQNDARFSTHNATVGAFLVLLGAFAGLAPTGDGDFVARFPAIDSLVDGLQMTLIATSLALVISGIGINKNASWGFPLAFCCGVSYLIAGIAFVVSWLHIKNAATTVEEAVSVIGFVKTNMDMLLGLVDGGAIFYFLKNSSRKTARQQSDSLLYS